jgi:hypothetical protein
VKKKPPIPSPSADDGRRFAAVIALLQAISIRGRLVAWLLMFISGYRLGMPILFSAALAGLPWLLLPPSPKGDREVPR